MGLGSKGAVFADVGAGTGIFTRELAKRGADVFAVEPNDDMREQLLPLSEEFANVKIISAAAEETTLADNSIDVITVAQALHWFDAAAFAQECRRIGKAGAIVVAVYNNTPGGTSINLSKDSTVEFFKNPTIREFPNPIKYSREKWITYMTSHSYDPLPSDPLFEAHMTEVNAVFEEENINGFVHREIVTTVYHQEASKL